MSLPKLLSKAYSSEHFRQEGHRLIDQLADHLAAVTSGKPEKMYPEHSPKKQLEHWQSFPEGDWRGELLANSIHLHHPHYMGHQVSVPVPTAALTAVLAGLLNNGMAVYEMGPAASAMEHTVIAEVTRAIGWTDQAGGVFTSGGTLANLTALLTARNIKAADKVWQTGNAGQYALLVSEEAHYCIDRAVRVMGWGEAGIITVPVDDQFRMRTDLLPDILQKARAAGKEVLAVVGCACSTATGSFDDLEALADFCEAEDLWLHVDAAHAGAAVFSERHHSLLQGINRADSVIMDFHKMGATPALSTALVFRDGRHNFRTFAQQADYLYTEMGEEWHNIGKRTIECTKTMMAAQVYGLLQEYGTALFAAYVDHCFVLGRKFAQLIDQRSGFELLVDPACNILVFRVVRDGLSSAETDAFNQRLREKLLAERSFYVVSTRRRGQYWLRSAIMNPFTEEKHFAALLDRLEEVSGLG